LLERAFFRQPEESDYLSLITESWAEMQKTFAIIDELGKKEVAVTPSTPMYQQAVAAGFTPPATMKDWMVPWDSSQPAPPYADKRAREKFYRSMTMKQNTALLRFPILTRSLQSLARWRWKHRFFTFSLDYYLPWVVILAMRKTGLKKVISGICND
jgi:hypothetical protein